MEILYIWYMKKKVPPPFIKLVNPRGGLEMFTHEPETKSYYLKNGNWSFRYRYVDGVLVTQPHSMIKNFGGQKIIRVSEETYRSHMKKIGYE